MAEARTNRRLAAILAADVVGYSRMMAADETGTLAALKRHREAVFDPAVAGHNGRIVKLIGDGTLVEFASVVDAVNCALAVQQAADPSITLRIGVNLGDVIIEGDDIYGDGVNIAARLEPLAEPGGICVASIVNESVGNRINVAFVDSGEVRVKNIERPVRVWKWSPGNTVGAAARKAPTPAPVAEMPSIAVLPFANMSGDAEQEYFSDGITEDIITDLSKVGGLLVIARNSSFAYKGRHVDVRTIAGDLNVRSVLEGSIRRAGNRVRITAQLIDARTGGHVWAERYDRDLTDIFAVQDEVTRQIVAALKVTLSPSESALLAGSGTTDLEAYELTKRGGELLRGQNQNYEIFKRTTGLFHQAIQRDPQYAQPYTFLAIAHVFDYLNHWTEASDRSLGEAQRFARMGIEKGPSDPAVHHGAALVDMFTTKDLDRAAAEIETTLSLSPNFALAHSMRGEIKMYAGDSLAAIPHIERAMRLDPAFNHQYLHFLGTAYLLAGKYETAALLFRERIVMVPGTDSGRALLASTLGHLGALEEARRVWRELMTLNPTYSPIQRLSRLPFKQADFDRIVEGLTRAGLPD